MKYQRLICPEYRTITLQDYELPDSLAPDEVLLQNTHGAEKHGTMEAYVSKHGNSRGAWDQERLLHTSGQGVGWAYPIPLGNMQVGIVKRIGTAVSRYRVGDRVVAFRGFEPMSVIPESEGWKITPDTNWKSATLLDPATFALAALRDSGTRIGDATAIFSLGAIGLTAVILAKLIGCHPVVAIDPIAKRRDVARSLGADVVLDPCGLDVGAKLRDLTAGRGVDTVIEYSGSVPALNAALRGIAFGGTIACGAFPAPYAAGLDFGGEAHMNRPNIVFSRTESDPNRDHPRWDNQRVRLTVLRLILEGVIDGEAIIDPVVPFSPKLATTYRTVMADKENAVKMGLSY